MKLSLTLPLDGIEAAVVAYDSDGNEIDCAIARIEITPIFYKSASVPIVLYGQVLSGTKEKESHRFVVTMSGNKGRCKLDSRSDPIVPDFDKEIDTPKPKTPPKSVSESKEVT